MSEKLDRRLKEDRALRNAARTLLKADIAHLRTNLTGKSLGARFADRLGEGAVDVLEGAAEVASNNRGVIATLLAAIVLWFARNPIMALFSDDTEDGDHDIEEPDAT